jgi:hypothetical protein
MKNDVSEARTRRVTYNPDFSIRLHRQPRKVATSPINNSPSGNVEVEYLATVVHGPQTARRCPRDGCNARAPVVTTGLR